MGEQITYSISEAISETSVNSLHYFDKNSFDRLLADKKLDKVLRTRIFADMARVNALYMISRAGSGHVGSSFSSLDIVSWLYLNELGPNDRFFSSKGHDSPGLYAVQTALGIVPFDKVHTLRRFGGLPGHPDVSTPGAFTNTGSLGMGISKAKGYLYADKLLGKETGRVFVLTGDGELQEGQFWESLVTAAKRNDSKLVVIIDHNKVQSDTHVSVVSDLGDLDAKLKAFGWDCYRIDGHDINAIQRTVSLSGSKPLVIIADTIKGKGVSFMEHTTIRENDYYKYHSGAPNRQDYAKAISELGSRVLDYFRTIDGEAPELLVQDIDPIVISADAERMIPSYTDAILAEANRHKNLVALDADLILDTGLIPFKEKYPDRFIECGIAEQDMVSQAGTMALGGLIPIVHSFACFLTGRASEQIYNNCTQRRKVIYVGSLAGVLPAGPGHSHQAVRDIATMASMPEMTVIEPLDAKQVGEALHWAVNDNDQSVYIRLTSIPYTRRSELNEMQPLKKGTGHVLRKGTDAVAVVNGPVMTAELLQAADLLQEQGVSLKVIGMPWLNSKDSDWFRRELEMSLPLIVLENHFRDYGFANWFVSAVTEENMMMNRRYLPLGITGVPLGGRNPEVLNEYGLSAERLARRIVEFLRR